LNVSLSTNVAIILAICRSS